MARIERDVWGDIGSPTTGRAQVAESTPERRVTSPSQAAGDEVRRGDTRRDL